MKINRRSIKKAAKIIKSGGLVGFPTETVYGIAADPSSKKALAKLNKIKKRPLDKHYSLHVAYKKDIFLRAKNISPIAKKIVRKYLPGPITIILQGKGKGTIGFRMPDNKIALSLIRAVGFPVIAPSANVSGMKSPVKANEVCGGLDMVLDGGHTKYKKDSTVIDLTVSPPRILRQGCIKIDIK